MSVCFSADDDLELVFLVFQQCFFTDALLQQLFGMFDLFRGHFSKELEAFGGIPPDSPEDR